MKAGVKGTGLTLSFRFAYRLPSAVEQEWASPQPRNRQGPAGWEGSALLAPSPSSAEGQWLEEYSGGIASGQAQFQPYTATTATARPHLHS